MVAPAQQATAQTAESDRRRYAPTSRFVWLVAIVLVPVALAELRTPAAAALLAVAAGIMAMIAIVDLGRGLNRARGVGVRTRPVVRLSLGREATIDVELIAGGDGRRQIHVGLESPPLLGLEVSEPVVDLVKGTTGCRVSWPARPRRRGVFRPGPAHLGIVSPFGLWTVRWSLGISSEIRVYPNLQTEGRNLAALFLRRPIAGWRSQRLLGRGREFEKLREYLPGDSSDEIHWKATAKRGHPVTKVYQVERTQEIYAVVDASRLSGRSVAGASPCDDTLLEREINAALALALAAERQGDLFGLVTYADVPHTFVRAKNGPAHFQAVREALVSVQPTPVSPDLREVATFLRTRLRKRALIVFIVSLDDPALAESFVEAVRIVARQHLVLVVAPLPRDAMPLFSGTEPDEVAMIHARLGGHIRWQGLQDLATRLHRHGVQLALLERDELAAGVVSHYVALKQRQMI